MSAIDKILNALQDAALGQNFEYTIDAIFSARNEIAALRAAVAERDAAIEKAVRDERVQCAALARAMIGANRREIADAILSRTERTIP